MNADAKMVDLVHYVNGERVVIGKACVEFDGTHFDMTAKITHDDGSGIYGAVLGDIRGLSIDFNPRNAQEKDPKLFEVATIPSLPPQPQKRKRDRRW